jgi:TRAP-type C4-dicarboxylate transport system substrate-binding protein
MTSLIGLSKATAAFIIGAGLVAGAGLALTPSTAGAEAVKMKLHTWGSPRNPETKWIFEGLNKNFGRHSGGTLSFQTYYGMALGGKPRDLISQVENGVVDMAYTLPGYHAGRFPILEALELPFIATTGEAFSQVAWDWLEKYAHTEFKTIKVITLNAIDVGVLHTSKTPVRKMADLKGMKIRVAGRYIGMAVQSLGGVPVQMPLPAVYESLSRGQTQGMMIPWMITVPFKFAEVTKYHTNTPIYHSLLLTAMNMNTWNKLDARQKKAVKMSTGKSFAKGYGALWDKAAAPGIKMARDKGNELIKLSAAEEARWRGAAKSTHQAWIKEMDAKGNNGKQMFADLLAMVKKYSN